MIIIIIIAAYLHTHHTVRITLSCRLSRPHTQTHPLPCPCVTLAARWQWWMQNMKHINAADSGQCQPFLHCVKLNKQDQATVNGNWPSRDKAPAAEVGGHGNLKPSSHPGMDTHSKLYSAHRPNGPPFIYNSVSFSSLLQRWIIMRRRLVLYTLTIYLCTVLHQQ